MLGVPFESENDQVPILRALSLRKRPVSQSLKIFLQASRYVFAHVPLLLFALFVCLDMRFQVRETFHQHIELEIAQHDNNMNRFTFL